MDELKGVGSSNSCFSLDFEFLSNFLCLYGFLGIQDNKKRKNYLWCKMHAFVPQVLM